MFFGVSRNLLRERLEFENFYSFNLKNIIYLTLWKLSDFVGGLSDIRDTHSNLISRPLFPFLARVFTGLFFLYPINLFAFASFFSYWRRIRDSGLFIILISAFLSITPSEQSDNEWGSPRPHTIVNQSTSDDEENSV